MSTPATREEAIAQLDALRDSIDNLDLYVFDTKLLKDADGRRYSEITLRMPATQLTDEEAEVMAHFACRMTGWDALTAQLTFIEAQANEKRDVHDTFATCLAKVI